ncbi:uncharacterized protein [Euwallacea similis]|uniref:uncharacterized protein n=1 Tax=Euwallacea similis TaxID=1736056 RepID=UPI00344CCA69
MTKMDDIILAWKKFQLAKLQEMAYQCSLQTPHGLWPQAILKIVTTQGERRLEISCMEAILDPPPKYTLFFDKLNGFTPNIRHGTIQLGYGEDNHLFTLTFASQPLYTSVLNELRIFLREIANVPTPPSSDLSSNSGSSSDTSTSSNEEV